MNKIKLFFIWTALFLLCSTAGRTQFNQPDYQPRFGVLAGVQISNIVTSGNFSFTPLSSYHFGALVEFPLFDYYSLVAPQIIYSRQGYKQLANSLTNSVDTTTNLDFLNFPVDFKFYIYKGLALEPTIYIGFIIHSEKIFLDKLHTPQPENVTSNNVEIMGAGVLKNFDYGLGLGLSYNFKFGLFGRIKFYFGGQNIFPDRNGLPAGKTENFQLSIGYLFKNKK